MAYPRGANIAAYQTASAHGGVAASDSHGLVLMLMNGALERIGRARGCIINKSYADKAHNIHRSVAIIDELRNSLNVKDGGDVADGLNRLYDYMCRKLLAATVENNVAALDEVGELLTGIRDSWARISKEDRAGRG